MNKKAFLNISFAWLFAIIVGAFILFLAIFASTKIIKTSETQIDAETAKEIGILLNPLETGFETGKVSSISLPSETRIYNRCNNNGFFGRQIIKVSQKSFDRWTDTDMDIGFSNKYIFSEEYVEGKKFYLFSRPFDFPFKVSDLIYIVSSEKNYCFSGVDGNKELNDITDEISALNQKNFFLKECPENSVMVCFSGNSEQCDVIVNIAGKYVQKNNEISYFEGDSLMYAAIFSDKSVYECQLKRLMQRTESLALLYKDKADFVSGKECNSNLNSELLVLNNLANSLSSSSNLASVSYAVEEIKKKNNLANCKIF